MRRRLAVLMTAVLAMAVMIAAPPAQAMRCAGGVWTGTVWLCPLSVSTVAQREIGHGVGPNVYTGYGRAQVKSFASNGLTGSRYRAHAVLSISYLPPVGVGTVTRTQTREVAVDRTGETVRMYDAATGLALAASSGITWWNPGTWHWSSIFGSIFNAFHDCIVGVAKTLVSTVGTALVLKAVVDRALLAIGPDGWAILVVGSCISGILG